jgi:hypothetical protein
MFIPVWEKREPKHQRPDLVNGYKMKDRVQYTTLERGDR